MKKTVSQRFEDAIFQELPLMQTASDWGSLFGLDAGVREFERMILPGFMKKCRWFGGKARVISDVKIQSQVSLKVGDETHFLLIIEVIYAQGSRESYFLPVSFLSEQAVTTLDEHSSHSLICRVQREGGMGCIADSCYRRDFRDLLFASMQGRRQFPDGNGGFLIFHSAGDAPTAQASVPQESRILKADQSNTAIIYGDRYFFKFYRKVEREINPDLEIIRFLTERTDFRHAPRYRGSIQYNDADGGSIVLGMLQENVQNLGDAWVMTMNAMTAYYDAVLNLSRSAEFPGLVEKTTLMFADAPPLIQQLIGSGFSEQVMLLGRRTAEMHRALASEHTDPAFVPESLTQVDLNGLYGDFRQLVDDRFGMLQDSLPQLDAETRALASEILSYRDRLHDLSSIGAQTTESLVKTRIHGDYHLGQVLFTGDDFVIIDFEGEPGLSFRDRRLKRSPLKDVAGMMRSFHYAAHGKILLDARYRNQNQTVLELAAEQWQHYVSRFFLGSYMTHAGLGRDLSAENSTLIRTFLLEKAVYELGYELNARPDWVKVPLKGIQHLVRRNLGERGRERTQH